MKKIIYLIFGLLPFLFTGCESKLDSINLYQKDLNSFYKTPKDISDAMSGVYYSLLVDGIFSDEFVSANLMDDCMLGGGGSDDRDAQATDAFQSGPSEGRYQSLWTATYNGVFRANSIIEAVQNNDYSAFFATQAEADTYLKSVLGEAYFMRGFLMYRAARFFGGMPLIPTTSADRKVPRSSFTETFSFIAADFLKAIELLPGINAKDIALSTYGHANLWVAKAYLARTYLFYTGYMTNIEGTPTTEIPLAEGGSVKKADVIKALEDVRDKSGYKLTPNYGNLWPYAYVNESAKKADPSGPTPLPWAEKLGLKWVGQDGPNSTMGTGNYEVMFSVRYGFGNWGWGDNDGGGQRFNNRVPLFLGIRDNSLVPFGQGWGWGTIHTAFYNTWPNEDPRKDFSVINLNNKNADEGTTGWVPSATQMQETGLKNRKYTTIQHNGPKGTAGMFFYAYNWTNADMQLWAAQDSYYLRFSDILLMHSELTETADGMNAVRARVGLPPVTYSLDALKNERKWEFAFEALHWFDLVRWGDVKKSTANYFGTDIDITNGGVAAKYTVKYRPETKGLVAIPESEIRLSNGIYEQNPGW